MDRPARPRLGRTEIDREAFTAHLHAWAAFPISETAFWQSLPLETRWEVSRRSAAFMLSNFLHGEQGALMVAGPARERRARTWTASSTPRPRPSTRRGTWRCSPPTSSKLDEVHDDRARPEAAARRVLAADDWKFKAVGMQVVTEGLALYFFRDMRNSTEEPLLKKLLTYVSRDEARHTGYGIKYLSHVVPTLSRGRERSELEDFAFECTRNLMASRAGNTMRDRLMNVWDEAGVDPAEVMRKLEGERDLIAAQLARTGGRYGPVSGFIIPTLRAIGLYSERTAGSLQGDVDGDPGRRGGGALRQLRRGASGRPGAVGERGLREPLTAPVQTVRLSRPRPRCPVTSSASFSMRVITS